MTFGIRKALPYQSNNSDRDLRLLSPGLRNYAQHPNIEFFVAKIIQHTNPRFIIILSLHAINDKLQNLMNSKSFSETKFPKLEDTLNVISTKFVFAIKSVWIGS